MIKADDIEELIKDEPPAVKAALRRALQILEEDDGPEPDEAVRSLAKLGLNAAKGVAPGPAAIVEGIAALITIGRIVRQKRQKKIKKSRKLGTAAGLAARASSKKTTAQMQARGAAAAWARNRRKK